MPSSTWTARFDAENVVELSSAWLLIFSLIIRLLKYIAAVRQLVEELSSFVRLVEDVLWRHPQHLNDLIHLIDLIRPGEERLAGVHFNEDAAERPHVDGQVVGNAQQHFR